MDEWLKIIGALGGLEANPLYSYVSSESAKRTPEKKRLRRILWNSKFTFYH